MLYKPDERVHRVVEIVAGDSAAPGWLEPGLRWGAYGIFWAHQKAAEHPTGRELSDRLDALNEAIALITETLGGWDRLTKRHDRVVMRAVDAFAGKDLEGDREAWHSLNRLRARIDKTRKTIEIGRGRKKRPDPSSSGEEACAMLIVVAWRLIQGCNAPGTGRSNDACEALWQMATGDPDPTTEHKRRRWRDRIKAANLELDGGDNRQVGDWATRLLEGPHPPLPE